MSSNDQLELNNLYQRLAAKATDDYAFRVIANDSDININQFGSFVIEVMAELKNENKNLKESVVELEYIVSTLKKSKA